MIEHNFAAPIIPSTVHRSCTYHRQTRESRSQADHRYFPPHLSNRAKDATVHLVRVLYVVTTIAPLRCHVKARRIGTLLDIPRPFDRKREPRTDPPNILILITAKKKSAEPFVVHRSSFVVRRSSFVARSILVVMKSHKETNKRGRWERGR